MVGKLIEKVISKRIQFHITSNNFIHPSQLEGLKFKSMTDVDVALALTHIIWSGWVKNFLTSTLAFNIAQFFPSLNYHNIHSKSNDDKAHTYQLDNMVIEASSSPSTTIVVTDASIKNDVATSILHIHTHNNPIAKTIHHMVHVTSTEAKLFAMRYNINQTSNHNDISKIIIITDFIHMARKIFDLSSHLFQVHSVAILTELWKFFLRHRDNSIEFWECPSHLKWSLHKAVDKKTKAFYPSLLFPSMTL